MTAPDSILMAHNRMKSRSRTRYAEYFTKECAGKVRRVHEMIPSFAPTQLVSLKDAARRLGVKSIYVKDESTRFGMKAFKGLGGIYAMFRILCRELDLDPETATVSELLQEPYASAVKKMTFVTATDGNHGKGVSLAAKIFGAQARVYMPKGSRPVRAEAIRGAGNARVWTTEMTYDECVVYAGRQAEENGWFLIQDTSWDGFEQVPLWIMQGYLTLMEEAFEQMEAAGESRPTHVFVQAGVGALAGTAAAATVRRYSGTEKESGGSSDAKSRKSSDAKSRESYETEGGKTPVFCCVEPHEAACIYESVLADDGALHTAAGNGETIMAGLNCGTPCSVAWDILRADMDHAFSCPDQITEEGMYLLGNPQGDDRRVVSGESGAVAAGLVQALLSEEEYEEYRRKLELDDASVILIISTEGDTDPENYRKVVGRPGNSEE